MAAPAPVARPRVATTAFSAAEEAYYVLTVVPGDPCTTQEPRVCACVLVCFGV